MNKIAFALIVTMMSSSALLAEPPATNTAAAPADQPAVSVAVPAPAASISPEQENKYFSECKQIMKDVEKIRGLKFTNEVKMAVQTPDDFSKYISVEIEKQYGSTKEQQAYARALYIIGALKENINLEKTLIDIMKSEAAAHYDPYKKTYYLLMTNLDDEVGAVSSHELCHALQDQNFDLNKLLEGNSGSASNKVYGENSDDTSAKQCLAEGDATLVMMFWMLADEMGINDYSQLSQYVSTTVNMQALMDFETLMQISNAETDVFGKKNKHAKAMKDMENFPRFFMESFYMLYMQGSVFADKVRLKGGWAAINELYRHPPTSTEQILHPEKIIDKREEPIDVKLDYIDDSLPKGWKLVDDDVMGELGVRIFLSIWKKPEQTTNNMNKAEEMNHYVIKSAAAGWGGDHYCYFENTESKKHLLIWRTVWDTEKDAKEFEDAYRSISRNRFPSINAEGVKLDKGFEIMTNRYLKVVRHDKAVDIIDTTDKPLLNIELK